ncbi:transcriptional regulator with XRE-family HTH domain [Paenibacillus endophyticus]|uniref:Transcriptional regulator with XRE-family HTH domain n=1 Tax=Paenibacillus endophyticus TaxID=1294268 RepID=A0A7W5C6T1_9BACL|nr:helix-turn-helix transcriptional regulator [Paenibacillus endophyticus]MBB3152195.1 transcriptional regulator with XRE-family HTH domain [Paenibacillus endophyticus]
MSKLSIHVGIRIRSLRKNRGLTQEQLGELVQLPQPYIGGIERGEKNISLETLERIIQVLHIDPSDLFNGFNLPTSKHEEYELFDSIQVLLQSCSEKELIIIKKLAQVIITENNKL